MLVFIFVYIPLISCIYMLYNIFFAIAQVIKKQYLCTEIINQLIIAIMKEKLTKNDSKCKGAQEFKTIVAAFEAILSRNGLYIDYFASWGRRKELRYGDTLYSQWLEWARPRDPKKWMIAAFLFDAQNLPEMVWYDIDYKWNVWLEYNLKK